VKAFRSRFLDFARGRRGAQRGVARVHPLTSGARALRLAQAVGRRYAGQPGRRAFTPLILLKRAEPGNTFIQAAAGPLQMDFTVHVDAPAGGVQPGAAGPAGALELRSSVMETIQRLVEQHTRVVSASRAPADAPAAAPTRPAGQTVLHPAAPLVPELEGPPARRFRRQAAAGAPGTAAGVDAQPQTAAGAAALQAVPPAPPAALSAPEINRLAEQVIQTIDRRIIAQRERLGRS